MTDVFKYIPQGGVNVNVKEINDATQGGKNTKNAAAGPHEFRYIAYTNRGDGPSKYEYPKFCEQLKTSRKTNGIDAIRQFCYWYVSSLY